MVYDLFDRNNNLSRSCPLELLCVEGVLDHNHIDRSIMCRWDMFSEVLFEQIPIFYNALARKNMLWAGYKYLF